MSDKHTHPGVSRRTVARTAAWAVPVVITAVGAPAYAATSGGPCTDSGTAPLTASRDGANTGPIVTALTFVNGSTGKPTGVIASVTISQTDKNLKALPSDRLDSATGSVGHTDYNPGWNDIYLHQQFPMTQGDILTATLTFNKPVKNFTLSITDIDFQKDEWIDDIYVSPTGFAVTAKGKNITGTGVTGAPFTSKKDAEIHNADGDLTLTWPGTVTSVTITYVAGDPTNSSKEGQHIGIGKFAYNNCA